VSRRFARLELAGESLTRPLTVPPVAREHALLRRAAWQHRRARFEAALRDYSRALEHDPNLAAGWCGQARMLVELGEYDEAAVWARRALELHPGRPALLATLAVARLRRGHALEALGLLDQAVGAAAAPAWAWLARAELLLCERRTASTWCVLKARAAEPRDWFVSLQAARLYHYYGLVAAALDECARALRLDATQPWTWHVEGECRLALGRRAEARRAFERALSLDADFEPARHGLAALGSGAARGVLRRLRAGLERLLPERAWGTR